MALTYTVQVMVPAVSGSYTNAVALVLAPQFVDPVLGNNSASDNLTVTLNTATETGFTVPFDTEDGSATAGSDYSALNGVLMFTGTAGETQSLVVNVLADSIVETDETFSVVLGTPSLALVTLADGLGTGTINNDDSASLSVAPLIQAEGDSGISNFTFTLQLSGQVQGGFPVRAQTRDDSALAASDCNAVDEIVNFDASANASRTLVVGVRGDLSAEANERFWVDLSTSNQSISVAPASVAAEIINDDLIADLAVSNSRLAGTVVAGATVEYEVVVDNLSAFVDAPNAQFSFSVGAALGAVQWTCVAQVGANCPASGNGLPNHTIALGAGKSVTYRIRTTVQAGAAPNTPIDSTATIGLNSPYSDPVAGNNSATDQTVVQGDVAFRDGFEG